jgi:deoxyribonuclease IV
MARRSVPAGGDELGAHVSAAGGVHHVHARAAAIDARVLQLFTKQPSRWAEPPLDAQVVAAFREERDRHGVRLVASHDSYLINLASSDPVLFERSYQSFRTELERCTVLGIEYLVTHPGNATGGDRGPAIARNGAAIARALAETGSPTVVLLETTAGGGTALGARFEELAGLRDAVPAAWRDRVGVCLDTCHVWAAGYDLRNGYEDVIAAFDRAIGLDWLRLLHLNDSTGALGGRRDRHAGIGEGLLGEEPFRRLLLDERLRAVPKVIETPKGDDHVASDRANLGRLRSLRAPAVGRPRTRRRTA